VWRQGLNRIPKGMSDCSHVAQPVVDGDGRMNPRGNSIKPFRNVIEGVQTGRGKEIVVQGGSVDEAGLPL
jgi:hypothetical protein